MKEQYQQILVRYFSEALERESVENFWAIVVDADKGLYQVDNIPYYGPEFSCEDIIYAEYDEKEQCLTYSHVAKASGNSTVQVMVAKDDCNIEELYNEILLAGTEIEVVEDYYFVVNVLRGTDYRKVYAILAALEEEQVLNFAEPVLSPKHSADLRAK